MKNYYFLATLLPRLSFDQEPELTLEELEPLLSINLTPEDYAQTVVLRLIIDLYNIRALWLKLPFDRHGQLRKSEMEDALVTFSFFPDYVFDFLQRYPEQSSRLQHFSELIESYFEYHIHSSTGFLKQYLLFERELRWVMLGFRAKELNSDLALQLQYADPHDPIVAQIFSQKEAQFFVPPDEYSELKSIYEAHHENPLSLLRALSEYRLNKIKAMTDDEPFSINRILAYIVQLLLIETWQDAVKAKGGEIVESIVKEVR